MAWGQIVPKALQAVQTNKLPAINALVDSINKLERKKGPATVTAYEGMKRELVSGFTESSTGITEHNGYAEEHILVLNTITHNKQLVFVELSEQQSKKVDGKWEKYYAPLHRYKNDSLFALLGSHFSAAFEAPLDTNQLFYGPHTHRYTYGRHCGYAGVSPHWRTVTDSLVEHKNRAELFKLLQSTVTELQVYGVDGFHQLKELGFPPTDAELRLIKNILTKKGKISTCSGCTYWTRSLNDIFKGFRF